MSRAPFFGQEKDCQRPATDLRNGEQLSLLPARRSSASVDLAYLATMPNFRRAVHYSLSLADLEPKQVYEPLEMDKAIWSRIDNGGMSFPADKILPLRVLTGNDAPLMWLANAAGYEMKPRRSELEAKLEAERERATELERENALLRQLITGRK